MDNTKKSEALFKYYASFTLPELEEILKIDFLSSDNRHLTNEEIETILTLITNQKNKLSTSTKFDVDKSWNSFKKDYMPFVEKNETLYGFLESRSEKKNRSKVFAYKNIAAAFICLIMISAFATTTTAQNFFTYVANWTKNTFWFNDLIDNSIYSDSSNNIYNNLGIYFDNEPLTPDMLPAYLPDEFIFDSKEDYETDQKKFLSLYFTDESYESYLSVNITYFYEDINTIYEKDSSDISIYQKNGVDYYIMGNLNSNTVIWKNGPFEFQIDGTVAREELKKMIDSIPYS